MSHNAKEITARLLATENITVVHENIPTAAFNVKERTLHLPMWEDMDEDTYSHLIGHEVGHALYTPEDGWHDAICDRGFVFKQFLNVVEDARIEKLVQRRYPGLRRSFIKSYKKMLADGFFGANLDQINSGSLIDRINTYFKCGQSTGVQFDATERVWLDEISATETWEQVEDISVRLFEFAKAQAEQKVEERQQAMEDIDDSEDEEQDELMPSESPMDFDSEYDDDEEGEGSEGWGDDDEEVEVDDTQSGSTGTSKSAEKQVEDEMKSRTDEQLRKSIESEYNQTTSGVVKNALFRDFDMRVHSYKQVIEEVTSAPEKFKPYTTAASKLWTSFSSENKRVVNHMVKEFEMRKKAAEYVRAATAKTGTIDPVLMNNYKMTDDIFKKVTIVPEGKNHGFLIYVDFSGSMQSCLFDAVAQTLTLAMFCRQASIPFRVMSFTTSWNSDQVVDESIPVGYATPSIDTNVVELFSSDMRKSEFATMAGYLLTTGYIYSCTQRLYNKYKIYRYMSSPDLLSLGGTPMDEVVLGAVRVHDNFKAKHRLDKVNTFFITDGESAPFGVKKQNGYTDWFEQRCNRPDNVFRLVDEKTGRRYRVLTVDNKTNTNLTNQCLRLYRDRTGSKVIGYRIIPHQRREVEHLADQLGTTFTEMDKVWEDMKQTNLCELRGSGYDQYFLISTKGLRVESGELEVKENASKANIRSAFKKAQSGKKSSRELTNRIMKLVA